MRRKSESATQRNRADTKKDRDSLRRKKTREGGRERRVEGGRMRLNASLGFFVWKFKEQKEKLKYKKSRKGSKNVDVTEVRTKRKSRKGKKERAKSEAPLSGWWVNAAPASVLCNHAAAVSNIYKEAAVPLASAIVSNYILVSSDARSHQCTQQKHMCTETHNHRRLSSQPRNPYHAH